ncbi:MAG: adenylyltransferase [Peptococcaceae bacterium]|nr:adenylyltransferase [Peptococcaceae bacterium]
MSLTKDQIERYSRHIVLEGIGANGQKKIIASSVLLIGAGGLASPVAYYLAAAGVGTIGLIDDDIVSISNLQRQILHFTNDVGRPKVLSARDKLTAINPACHLVVLQDRLTINNVMKTVKDFDAIVDCTDNFETRFIANDACVQMGKPFFHGAVLRYFGQALTVLPGKGPCYRCVFNSPPPSTRVQTSAQVGLLSLLPGTIGTVQATEVLKYFLGVGDLLVGRMLSYNALSMEFSRLEIRRNPHCPACGHLKTSS